jgi:hypothetical protein
MPLKRGKMNIGRNIREMKKAGYPKRRAVAASLNKAYGPKKEGEKPKPILIQKNRSTTTMKRPSRIRRRRRSML